MPRLKGILRWSGLAALLMVPQLWAEESGRWLDRMAAAAQEQSYHGSYVYERVGIFTTQDIWRQVDENGVHERLLQTAGRQQEWVRHNGQLVCATAPTLADSSNSGSVARLAIDSKQLAEWYNLRVLGGTRIAARPVTVIAVQPKDAFRYAHELYIDNETGLMLKSLLVDDHKELLERFQFATISFEKTAYRAGLNPSSSCLDMEISTLTNDAELSFWEPAWLPPGYIPGARQMQKQRDSETFITAQTYSDGLGSFTLFVERLGKESLAEDLRAQLGPTVAVSRRLMTADNLFLATVVGEIPPRAAERIAESLGQSVTGVQK